MRFFSYFCRKNEVMAELEWSDKALECMEKENYAQAKEYLEKALEEGEIEAYCDLGNLYFEGNGVEKNYKRAFDYYQKGLGNGSCGRGTGTLSQYNCPVGTFTNKLRFRPMWQSETAINGVTTPANDIRVSVVDGRVICTGNIAAGTMLRVYDLGGSTVATATASSATQQLTVSLSAQPRGTYLVKVGTQVFKVIR